MTQELVKSLGFYDLTALGVASVIGCGIFFLFSNILQRAGSQTALAFLLAAVPNIIASIIYAELVSMYDSNAIEYESLKDAFNENVASIAIYVLIVFMIFNATTIIIFASHILHLERVKFIFCLMVLFVLSIVNFVGIDLSKKIINMMSIVELGILAVVIGFGMRIWRFDKSFFTIHTNPIKSHSFWVASFLAIFLYTGYDAVIKMTNETKDAVKTVPKAIITTVLITTVLYVLIAFTAVSMPQLKEIGKSVMPIAKIFEYMMGSGAYLKLIYMIGLFIVLNTFFVCIISLSRFIYGLSKEGKLHPSLSSINDRFHTPHNAIIAVFVAIGCALLVESGEKTAMISNIFFLMFMVILGMALIILRLNKPDLVRPFKVPGSIGKIPVLVALGILTYIFYIALAFCSFSDIN